MTLENFDELLSWLDPDREMAGAKYESIRRRIIKIFSNRGCRRADEIADETMNRVCRKVTSVAATYEGDPALYFYAVAKNVYLEFTKPARPLPAPAPQDSTEKKELLFECLSQCLDTLEPQQRELVVQFYEGEKKVRIDNRKRLAEIMGINTKVLSLRVHRLRRELRKCMDACLRAVRYDEVDSTIFH